MSNEMIGFIGLIAILILMFLKVPLGVTFALVGGMGTIILRNFDAAMSAFARIPYSWTSEYSFSCLPMFCMMGVIVAETEIARDLYSAAHKWVGHLPGGLAMTTLMVTALFSAVSGSSVAAVATISLTCYPEMKRYGYDPSLASGVIASGSTMDIMIPPSIPMIIYAMVAEVSVGKMFVAGFLPGIVEVLVFCLIIFIMVKRNPSIAGVSSDTTPFLEKLKGLQSIHM